MKSLYESILSSTKSGKAFIWDKTKPIIDRLLNANSEFPMLWFLEENNLRLDKDNIKKIVNKIKKVLPKDAIFGRYYGIPQIAKQGVEYYGSVNFTDIVYAYYKIEITYGTTTYIPYSSVLTLEMDEFLIYLTNDYIYVLDIPETKSILAELDDHFAKYVTQDKVKLTDTYNMKSKIGGKYRVYSFKDITKEFIKRK